MLIARQMRSYAWNDGKELHIGRDSLVMGVLNITDDSFSDGGKWDTLETAMKHAKDMVEDGAAIVDIGQNQQDRDSRPFRQRMRQTN